MLFNMSVLNCNKFNYIILGKNKKDYKNVRNSC